MKINIYIFLLLKTFLLFVPNFCQGYILDITSNMHIAKAIAEGRSSIDLMIAVHEGRYKEFRTYLEKNDLKIKFEAPDLDYVRVSVPIPSINRLLRNRLLKSVNTEAQYPPLYYSTGTPLGTGNILPEKNLQELLNDPSIQNDISDLASTGLLTMRKSAPYADGRGVTIAFIEGFIDPDTPEMKLAQDVDGNIVPKVRAIYEANSYMATAFPNASIVPDHFGVKMERAIAGADSVLKLAGREIRVSGPGWYWVGLVDEANYRNVSQDFNKDGNRVGTSSFFVLARKDGEGCFRVDINQNNDLTDDSCLGDFNASRQTGRFATKSEDVLGTRFYILTTPRPDWIVFATPEKHAHFVASAAVGSSFSEHGLVGAAPGAKIINIGASSGGTSAFLEAFIRAGHDPEVDIIFVSSTISSLPQGGQEIHNIILDRIVEKKNKIIIVGAGNSGNMSSAVNVLAAGENILAVGQFHSKKVKKSLFGIDDADSSNLASSGGPLIDGRIKPDILAPSLIITTNSDSLDEAAISNQFNCPNLKLPPRVMCSSGTSLASPVAAGVVASLLSIAKKELNNVQALQIVDAIRYSASHIATIPVYLQGHGLINIEAASRYLKSGIKRPVFDIKAPVPRGLAAGTGKTVQGKGLFEREGWYPGMEGVRVISIVRKTGPEWGEEFTLRLIGDSARAYSVPARLTIPLNETVKIPLSIVLKKEGLHSALLELRSEKIDEIAVRINLTTIAAVPLMQIGGPVFEFKRTGSEWEVPIVYVDVPENMAALGFEVDIPDAHMGFFPLRGPIAGVDAMVEFSDERNSTVFESSRSGFVRRTIIRPAPGVWQLAVPYRVPEKNKIIISGRINMVSDDNIKNTLDMGLGVGVKSKINMVHNLNRREVVGIYKNGFYQNRNHTLPHLVPIIVPDHGSHIEIRARVKNVGQYKDTEGIIALALLECDEKSLCNYVDTAIGRVAAGISRLVNKNKRVYAAFAPLTLGNSASIVEYEIFIPLEDVKSTIKFAKSADMTGVYSGIKFIDPSYRLCYIPIVGSPAFIRSVVAYNEIKNDNIKSDINVIDYGKKWSILNIDFKPCL